MPAPALKTVLDPCVACGGPNDICAETCATYAAFLFLYEMEAEAAYMAADLLGKE